MNLHTNHISAEEIAEHLRQNECVLVIGEVQTTSLYQWTASDINLTNIYNGEKLNNENIEKDFRVIAETLNKSGYNPTLIVDKDGYTDEILFRNPSDTSSFGNIDLFVSYFRNNSKKICYDKNFDVGRFYLKNGEFDEGFTHCLNCGTLTAEHLSKIITEIKNNYYNDDKVSTAVSDCAHSLRQMVHSNMYSAKFKEWHNAKMLKGYRFLKFGS